VYSPVAVQSEFRSKLSKSRSGNRSSGIALADHHRLSGIIDNALDGLSEGHGSSTA